MHVMCVDIDQVEADVGKKQKLHLGEIHVVLNNAAWKFFIRPNRAPFKRMHFTLSWTFVLKGYFFK